ARFVEEGTRKAEAALAAFLAARADAAGLDIREARAAAENLVTLAIGTILRRRLYGADAAEPDEKAVAATADRALAAFLAAARAGVW
ncbi:MAG TPA: TetR/AcrR family transcriptional regulator C-terminal domain-containing protein, partial [Hyphomicrobiales bacterium]|nr:TetR/AcrR family transcriptional regulator C-terminal domain-containing protein [Hyphomicrobiales bacterium]